MSIQELNRLMWENADLRARLAEVEAEAEKLAGLLGEMVGRTKLAESRIPAFEKLCEQWKDAALSGVEYSRQVDERAEAAEAKLAEVEAERYNLQCTVDYDLHYQRKLEAKLAEVKALCEDIWGEAQGFEPISEQGEIAMSTRMHMMQIVLAALRFD